MEIFFTGVFLILLVIFFNADDVVKIIKAIRGQSDAAAAADTAKSEVEELKD